MVEGKEKSIAYASRTMSKEIIDKEVLSVIFGITKIHQYLASRQF